MTRFEDYSQRYSNVRMHRENGVILVTLHTNGGSLRWSLEAHRELP